MLKLFWTIAISLTPIQTTEPYQTKNEATLGYYGPHWLQKDNCSRRIGQIYLDRQKEMRYGGFHYRCIKVHYLFKKKSDALDY